MLHSGTQPDYCRAESRQQAGDDVLFAAEDLGVTSSRCGIGQISIDNIMSAVLISALQMLLNVFISFFQALFQEVYLRYTKIRLRNKAVEAFTHVASKSRKYY